MTLTKKVERLFQNPDFKELIIDEFIDNRIKQLVLNEDVSKQSVQDELKARRILNEFLQYCLDYDSINSLKTN